MAKLFLSIVFVSTFLFSLKLYFDRDKKTLRESFEEVKTAKPSVILEGFTFYKFVKTKLDSQIEAKLGQFVEPNTAEFFGDFKIKKFKEGRTEVVSSETAIALFKAEGLAQMLGDTELEKIILQEFVKIDLKDNTLTTDYAEYIEKTKEITSSSMVRVDGLNRWFTGKEGFKVDLEKESVDIFGSVYGELRKINR
jgi:LPS export ABC transporter protein LptC